MPDSISGATYSSRHDAGFSMRTLFSPSMKMKSGEMHPNTVFAACRSARARMIRIQSHTL